MNARTNKLQGNRNGNNTTKQNEIANAKVGNTLINKEQPLPARRSV